MNSTSRSDERRLRRFWRKKVNPASELMRARGVPFLGADAAGNDASWYVAVNRTEAVLVEIESSDVARLLADLWGRQGLPELEAIGPDIARLAARLLVDDADSRELSDDVYAMY